MKNRFFMLFLPFLIRSITASEYSHFPFDCALTIVQLTDLSSISSLKRTCHYFNDNLLFWKHISPEMVISADKQLCDRAIEHFSYTDDMDNFNFFMKKIPHKYINDLIWHINRLNGIQLNAAEHAYTSIEKICEIARPGLTWQKLCAHWTLIKMIAFSQNPNVFDSKGSTLFMWACGNEALSEKKIGEAKSLELIQALLKNEATDFNEQASHNSFEEGSTGFMIACKMGNLNIINLLLKQNESRINFNARNIITNHTAFTLMCSLCKDTSEPAHNCKEVLALLIPDKRIKKDYDVLLSAPELKDFVQKLLNRDKKLNKKI